MREITTKTKVFELCELSERAKENARDICRNYNVEHNWWESLFDDAKQLATIFGIDINKIYFTGFSYQGDGACFSGSYEYSKGWKKKLLDYAPNNGKLLVIGERLQEAQRRLFYSGSATTERRGHYSHSGCMVVNVDYGDSQSLSREPEEEIVQVLREFANWIYSRLRNEFVWLTSNEMVEESIQTNEIEFLVDGQIA